MQRPIEESEREVPTEGSSTSPASSGEPPIIVLSDDEVDEDSTASSEIPHQASRAVDELSILLVYCFHAHRFPPSTQAGLSLHHWLLPVRYPTYFKFMAGRRQTVKAFRRRLSKCCHISNQELAEFIEPVENAIAGNASTSIMNLETIEPRR